MKYTSPLTFFIHLLTSISFCRVSKKDYMDVAGDTEKRRYGRRKKKGFSIITAQILTLSLEFIFRTQCMNDHAGGLQISFYAGLAKSCVSLHSAGSKSGWRNGYYGRFGRGLWFTGRINIRTSEKSRPFRKSSLGTRFATRWCSKLGDFRTRKEATNKQRNSSNQADGFATE